jgi:hypothetical protein
LPGATRLASRCVRDSERTCSGQASSRNRSGGGITALIIEDLCCVPYRDASVVTRYSPPSLSPSEHESNGHAANAHQAAQSPVVVVLETIVQAVKPPLKGLGLWTSHGNDEPQFRDGPSDLDAWRLLKNRMDVER